MKTILSILIAATLFTSCTSQSKFGYFNSEEVLKDVPAVKAFKATSDTLNAGFNTLKATLQNLEAQLKSLPDGAEKNSVTSEVIAKQNELNAYVESANKKLTADKASIEKVLNDAIAAVAKAKGLDKLEPKDAVSYYSTKVDYTKEVKAAIN